MNQKEDKYPEILALKAFCKEKTCTTTILNGTYKIHSFLTPVLFAIDGIEVTLHLQDEYEDLSLNNPLLNNVLCLQELELIEDSTDYLNWLQFQSINKSTEKLRSYYQQIVNIIPSIRSKFTNNIITSFIPGLDCELNSNSMYYLRKDSSYSS